MVRSNLGHAASIDAMTHRLHAPLSCTQHFSGSHPGPTLRLHTSHWRRERGRWSPQTWHFGALAIDEQLAHWPEQPRSVAVEPTNLGLQGCRVTFILLIFHPSRPTIIEYAMDIRVHFSWSKNATSVRPKKSITARPKQPITALQAVSDAEIQAVIMDIQAPEYWDPCLETRVKDSDARLLAADCWSAATGGYTVPPARRRRVHQTAR
jgi:hypothetical protein